MKRIAILLLLLTACTAAAQQASDYVPDITAWSPAVLANPYATARTVGADLLLRVRGDDPNNLTGDAEAWRLLVVEAVTEVGGEELIIDSDAAFADHGAELLPFDHPGWSPWIPLADGLGDADLGPVLEEGRTYLIALQVIDEHGLASTSLDYGRTVHNVRVEVDLLPALTVRETELGEALFTGVGDQVQSDVAGGQTLRFQWEGSADAYGGAVASYRWGLDVADLDDPLDPGWRTPPGIGPEFQDSGAFVLNDGLHVLTVDCRDTAGRLTRARWVLAVVPVPEWNDRRPVLLVDGVRDQLSQLWPTQTGSIPYDRDQYRDAFWDDVLAPVAGWSPTGDVVDLELDATFGLRDAVIYRTLLWTTARRGVEPVTDGENPWPWLLPYVETMGHLFLAGNHALMNFSTSRPNEGAQPTPWLMPLIYEAMEPDRTCGGAGPPLALSFGVEEDGEGGPAPVGVHRFGYRGAGMSVVNLLVPPRFWLTDMDCGTGGIDVTRRCAGTKAVVLDPAFAAAHGTAGAMPDTVPVWSTIDWADHAAGPIPDLALDYPFGAWDEVYDVNATTRPTPWSPQELDDGTPVLEPMWRVYARHDWIRDRALADGDTDWPGDLDVEALCGSWAVDLATGVTRHAGAPIGVLSHKHAATKPSPRADVYWGFDPYRMDHDAMTQAVHWVLGTHFGHELNR